MKHGRSKSQRCKSQEEQAQVFLITNLLQVCAPPNHLHWCFCPKLLIYIRFFGVFLSITSRYQCCCCSQLVWLFNTQRRNSNEQSCHIPGRLRVVPLKSNVLPSLSSNEQRPFASLIPFQMQRNHSCTERFVQTKVEVELKVFKVIVPEVWGGH